MGSESENSYTSSESCHGECGADCKCFYCSLYGKNSVEAKKLAEHQNSCKKQEADKALAQNKQATAAVKTKNVPKPQVEKVESTFYEKVLEGSSAKKQASQKKSKEENYQDLFNTLVDLDKDYAEEETLMKQVQNQINQLHTSGGRNKKQKLDVAKGRLEQITKRHQSLESLIKNTYENMKGLKSHIELIEDMEQFPTASILLFPKDLPAKAEETPVKTNNSPVEVKQTPKKKSEPKKNDEDVLARKLITLDVSDIQNGDPDVLYAFKDGKLVPVLKEKKVETPESTKSMPAQVISARSPLQYMEQLQASFAGNMNSMPSQPFYHMAYPPPMYPMHTAGFGSYLPPPPGMRTQSMMNQNLQRQPNPHSMSYQHMNLPRMSVPPPNLRIQTNADNSQRFVPIFPPPNLAQLAQRPPLFQTDLSTHVVRNSVQNIDSTIPSPHPAKKKPQSCIEKDKNGWWVLRNENKERLESDKSDFDECANDHPKLFFADLMKFE